MGRSDPSESLKPGPVGLSQRKCTDVLFLLLFILFWVGMIFVASFGIANGDVRRLYMPMDVYGNTCGMDNTRFESGSVYDFDSAVRGETDNCNTKELFLDATTRPGWQSLKKSCDFRRDMTDYKYLVFVRPKQFKEIGGFCARRCPIYNATTGMDCPDPSERGLYNRRDRPLVQRIEGSDPRRCYYRRYSIWYDDMGTPAGAHQKQVDAADTPASTTCTDGVLPDGRSKRVCSYNAPLTDNFKLPNPGIDYTGVAKSLSLVYRCIPDPAVDSDSGAVTAAADVWMQLWGDVYRSWRIFLICLFAAFVLGFIWIFLMKYIAGPMVWLTLLLVAAGIFALGYFFLQYAQWQKDDKENTDKDSNTIKALQGLAYTLFALGALYLCALCYLASKINLAIALIKESSQSIQDMPGMVFFPIFIFILLAGFIVYWITVACFLMSAGTVEPRYADEVNRNHRPTSAYLAWNTTLRYMLIYHFFGLLWSLGMLMALMFITLGIAVALWFFTKAPKSHQNGLPLFPVKHANWIALRKHLGTLAFGSLIIAIVQFIRAVLLFLTKYADKLKGFEKCKGCIKCCLCYCSCLMAYVKRFLEFINKNAYCQTAIRGYNFCKAAKSAWELIVNNVVTIGTVNFVADFVCVCGKLLIVIADCLIAFRLTREDWAIEGGDHTELQSPLLVVIIVAIIAWFVASLFTHVYESTMTCMLICFIVDKKDYGGEFSSPNLKRFIDDSEKKNPGPKAEASQK